MSQPEHKPGLLIFEYGCALLLGFIGVVVFVLSQVDPWSWPSLDMATFYVAVEHPSLSYSDFFTSCFGRDNGRQVFGMLTSWPMHLGLNWYQTLYFWMLVGSSLLPISLFLGIQIAIPRRSKETASVLFLFLLAVILYPVTARYFAVAWWTSWGNEFHPSRFAIALVFFSIRSFCSTKLTHQLFGVILVVVSALCHPSFAVGGLLFISVLLLSSRRFHSIAKMAMSLLGAFVVIRIISNSGSLSTQEYLNWFAWLHPEHYIPSRYLALTLSPMHWIYPALTIFSALVTAGIILRILGANSLVRVCTAYAGIYGASILLQFLFVEKFPFFKLMILIAPVRFAAFGWMMVMVSGTLVLTQFAYEVRNLPYFRHFRNIFPTPEATNDNKPTPNHRFYIFLIIMCVPAVFVSISVFALTGLGEPSSHLDSSKNTLLLWISRNTNIADDIAAPDFLAVEIPLLTLRGTYHGNGFPFNDRCLEENSRRFTNLWGSPKSIDWPGYSRHYESLTILDFIKMTPRVDWAIMKSGSIGAARSATIVKPSFQNQNYMIFKIKHQQFINLRHQ